MAKQILQDCKLWFGGYDLSGDMGTLKLNADIDVKSYAPFGAGGFRKKLPGLQNVTAEHEGFWEAGLGKVDEVLFNKIASLDEVMTIAPQTGAEGEKAYILKSLLASYVPKGQVGELFAFTVSAEGNSGLVQGTIMLNVANLTASGNGTARNLGAVAANQKLYAALHVLAVSGATPSLTVKIQSDDASGFLSPIDRIIFAQATAIGAQYATPVAGPITDNWWRVAYTIGGTTPSFTAVVVVGIQ